MRIGIDADGVLRDFIGNLISHIKENHPEHGDKIGVPKSWQWNDWLPFWTDDETEKYNLIYVCVLKEDQHCL